VRPISLTSFLYRMQHNPGIEPSTFVGIDNWKTSCLNSLKSLQNPLNPSSNYLKLLENGYINITINDKMQICLMQLQYIPWFKQWRQRWLHTCKKKNGKKTIKTFAFFYFFHHLVIQRRKFNRKYYKLVIYFIPTTYRETETTTLCKVNKSFTGIIYSFKTLEQQEREKERRRPTTKRRNSFQKREQVQRVETIRLLYIRRQIYKRKNM
jgi:hypothetical protein